MHTKYNKNILNWTMHNKKKKKSWHYLGTIKKKSWYHLGTLNKAHK